MPTEVIYVPLADEGIDDVWAPAVAEAVGEDAFQLPAESPPDQTWQYAPGTTVLCERRLADGKLVPWAVETAG